MFNLTRLSPVVKSYKRYRNTSRDLNQKIMNAYVNDQVLEKATRALKMGGNRQIVVDSQAELDILMEYALYEVRLKEGKNQVQRYAEERGGSNDLERDLLTGMAGARTGLFQVTGVSRRDCQIELVALPEREQSITLVDINFSQTLMFDLILFFRPIRLPGFVMSSGICFIFQPNAEPLLVRRWGQGLPQDDAERYVWYFKRNKRIGMQTKFI